MVEHQTAWLSFILRNNLHKNNINCLASKLSTENQKRGDGAEAPIGFQVCNYLDRDVRQVALCGNVAFFLTLK
jgi:hypothetical protein